MNQVTMPWLSDARCKENYPVVVKLDDNRYYAGGITSWGYGCNDGGVYLTRSPRSLKLKT
jgi:hypothetical protein